MTLHVEDLKGTREDFATVPRLVSRISATRRATNTRRIPVGDKNFDDVERSYDDVERSFDDVEAHSLDKEYDDTEKKYDDVERNYDDV